MKILMGTTNPGKIQGARQAFEKYFENFLRIFVLETFSVLGVVEGGSALSNFI